MNAIFEKSRSVELETECIVLTFDLAFYAKAQPVYWNDVMYMQRTVIRLGESHTYISFLSVIGKHFEDSELADILLKAGTVTQGLLPWVIKGRYDNLYGRVIKIMAKALRRKLLSTFKDTQ